ncbi:MAG: tRNA (guanosine(46)-N7)-methyltransferase TrmB [Bacteroidota bacterium]
MVKNKLLRFEEMKSFSNVIQFPFEEVQNGFWLKEKWNEVYFKNNNPIVLELACGKGEYAIGLAEKFPQKNFIGIDIKGSRLWRGAKTALEKNLLNVAFLRMRIDFIEHCFAKNEVSEIWITFPDPQPNKEKKRLTHAIFLNRYKNILKPNSSIHLKTDNAELYEFTLKVIKENNFHLLLSTNNLYSENIFEFEEAKSIQTFYEKQFLAERKNITYLSFLL